MVTATQLSSYLYCPRKLFISTVLLVEEPPKQELVKGKIWHETYESINNIEEHIVSSIRTGNYQEIFEVYRKEYSRLLRNAIIKHKSELKDFGISMLDIFKDYWTSFEEEAKEHALNVVQFIAKHDLYGKELWDRLTPKILAEQYFKSVKLNLSGIIDVLEMHDTNGKITYVPVELKTGKYPDKGMWDSHRIQLAAYILLLEDAGKDVAEAAIRYRGTDKRLLQMNTYLREEVLDLITKTTVILTGVEPPNYVDNKNKCGKCQFKETCYNQDMMTTLVKDAKLRLKKQS
jgi:CRISPR-associated protein Cas4